MPHRVNRLGGVMRCRALRFLCGGQSGCRMSCESDHIEVGSGNGYIREEPRNLGNPRSEKAVHGRSLRLLPIIRHLWRNTRFTAHNQTLVARCLKKYPHFLTSGDVLSLMHALHHMMHTPDRFSFLRNGQNPAPEKIHRICLRSRRLLERIA